MAKITFGYVSKANPFIDRKAWSGTIFKIRESIEQAGYTGDKTKCIKEEQLQKDR